MRQRGNIEHELVIVKPERPARFRVGGAGGGGAGGLGRTQLVLLGVVGSLMLAGGFGVVSCSSSASRLAKGEGATLADAALVKDGEGAEGAEAAASGLDGAAADLEKLFSAMGESSSGTSNSGGERIVAVPPAPRIEEEERMERLQARAVAPTVNPAVVDEPAADAGASVASLEDEAAAKRAANPEWAVLPPETINRGAGAAGPAGGLASRSLDLSAIIGESAPAGMPPRLADRRSELVKELAEAVSADAGAGASALRAALPLAALEAIEPGSVGRKLDELEVRLGPKEQFALSSLRRVHAKLQSDDATDAGKLARTLESESAALTAASGGRNLEVVRAALCTRVESFGRFTPFESARFLGGRANAMIVYAELAGFTQQRVGMMPSATGEPASSSGADGGEWGVDLGMELELIAADGLVVWRQPESVLKDAARSKRNDLFVVQKIELPAAVSVGQYTLKVRVRDRLASSEAEENVPVEVVADAGLIGQPGAPVPGVGGERPTAGMSEAELRAAARRPTVEQRPLEQRPVERAKQKAAVAAK